MQAKTLARPTDRPFMPDLAFLWQNFYLHVYRYLVPFIFLPEWLIHVNIGVGASMLRRGTIGRGLGPYG